MRRIKRRLSSNPKPKVARLTSPKPLSPLIAKVISSYLLFLEKVTGKKLDDFDFDKLEFDDTIFGKKEVDKVVKKDVDSNSFVNKSNNM